MWSELKETPPWTPWDDEEEPRCVPLVPSLVDVCTEHLLGKVLAELDRGHFPPPALNFCAVDGGGLRAVSTEDVQAIATSLTHTRLADTITNEGLQLLQDVARLPCAVRAHVCCLLFSKMAVCPQAANPAVLRYFLASDTCSLLLPSWVSNCTRALSRLVALQPTSVAADEEKETPNKNEAVGTPCLSSSTTTNGAGPPIAPPLAQALDSVCTKADTDAVSSAQLRSLCARVATHWCGELLSRAATQCVSLTELDLSFNPGVVNDDLVLRFAQHCRSLLSVRIHSAGVTDKGCSALLLLPRLRSLDIQSCKAVEWEAMHTWTTRPAGEEKGALSHDNNTGARDPSTQAARMTVTVTETLQRLECSGCTKLAEGTKLRAALSSSRLSHLTRLNVSSCALMELPDSLSRLVCLQQLFAARNKLSTLPGVHVWSKLQQLGTLDVSGNQLYKLPSSLGALPRLTLLQARANRIARVDKALDRCAALTHIDMGYNMLSEWPSLDFSELKQLMVVELQYNHIQDVHGRTTAALAALRRERPGLVVSVSHQQV